MIAKDKKTTKNIYSDLNKLIKHYLVIDKLRHDAKEQEFWCSISYYEFNERVGEVWHASKDMTTVVIDG
jgi:hypothetical protein